MRDLVNWKDRVVEYPRRFKETTDSEGYITHEAEPGTVVEEGTPQNATNFNTMDYAALEAMLMASEAIRDLVHMDSSVDSLTGEKITVTLTNTQDYPFNNSVQTVQLSNSLNSTDYTVETEVVSITGNGGVGHFEITDKLVNGFKIAFTGGASEVVVNCYVRGGN